MYPTDLTWGRVLRIYWLYTWRAGLGGLLLASGAGFCLGFVGHLAGIPRSNMLLIEAFTGALISVVWSVIVVRMALQKTYRGFRLELVPA